MSSLDLAIVWPPKQGIFGNSNNTLDPHNHGTLPSSSALYLITMNRTRNLRILNIHTLAPRKPQFQCRHCIRSFFNKAGLQSHIRAKHTDIDDGNAPKSDSSPRQSPIVEQELPPRSPSLVIQYLPSMSPPISPNIPYLANNNFDTDDFNPPPSIGEDNDNGGYDCGYRYDHDHNNDHNHANNYQYQSEDSICSSTPIPIPFDEPAPPRHRDPPPAADQHSFQESLSLEIEW